MSAGTELEQVTTAVAAMNQLETGLAKMRETYGGMIYPVDTTKGMAEAKAARVAIREPRYEVERIRKAAKAPLLALGKMLDSEAARITRELTLIEAPIDEQITAEEARKEADKQARIAAQQKREADLRARIDELRGNQMLTAASGSDLIRQHIVDLENIPVDDSFEEFREQADYAKTAGLYRLASLLGAARAHEDEQKRLKDERAELAKLRAEQEERERVGKLAQERAAAEAKAKRDAEEAEARARREADDAEAAKQRAEDRRNRERNEMAMQEIQAIHHQLVIADTGRAPYCKGGDLQTYDWLLSETEKWPITEEKFGVLFKAAENAKASTLAALKQKCEALIQRTELAAREAALAEANKPKVRPRKPLSRQEIISLVAKGSGLSDQLAEKQIIAAFAKETA